VIAGADKRAADLIEWSNALDDAGLSPDFARRSRLVAGDLLDAVTELKQERSARRALQERCERLQAILGRRADQAARREAERRPS
jgi:hypothetical protein